MVDAQPIKVMYYDRGEDGYKRIRQNAGMIMAARDKLELALQEVIRHERFRDEPYTTELLSKEPLPFDAVLINGDSPGSKDVLEDAILAMMCNSLTLNRVIYFSFGGGNIPEGIQFIQIPGGDGYLRQEDAKNLIEALSKLPTS